ncbi:hypothetical protein [Enterococcus sp. DIV1758]|uniref:hypothetical protein n=1 Tax=Enterococcus sp. DIV1758 TaxID=2774744 RepID=UPI003F1FEE1A
MKVLKDSLSKTQFVIKRFGSKFVFSLGLGGLISLYIVEFFKVKMLPHLNNFNKLHEVLADNNILSIGNIEIIIFIVSMVSIISAPLLSLNDSKKNYSVVGLIILLFVEMVAVLSVCVSQQIGNLFIVCTTILCVYLIWLLLDILKIAYAWTKIDKTEKNQIDVAKLTFIWAIIVFLLGLFK